MQTGTAISGMMREHVGGCYFKWILLLMNDPGAHDKEVLEER